MGYEEVIRHFKKESYMTQYFYLFYIFLFLVIIFISCYLLEQDKEN